jgi:hypothetical protein
MSRSDPPVSTEEEKCAMARYRFARYLTKYSNAATTLSGSRCTKTPAKFAAELKSSKLSFRRSIMASKFLLLIETNFEVEWIYLKESDFKHSCCDSDE